MEYKFIFLAIFIVEKIFKIGLTFINLNFAKKHQEIPAEFTKQIDKATTEKQVAYLSARTRFKLVEVLFETLVISIFFFSPLYEMYNSWILSLNLSFMYTGKLFIFIILAISTIFGIPFSLYYIFKLEKSFGFSTMTFGLWVVDFFKSIGISILIMSIITTVGFWAIQASPKFWWLILWAFFCLFSLFIMFIFPYVIAPLFFKFTPLKKKKLATKISDMLTKVDIKMKRVLVMDASKRSNHVNAFFTGIGKSKCIVFYDTILEKLTHDKIIAVLAHEAGHWKYRHILKRITIIEILSLPAFYIAFRVLQTDLIQQLLGVTELSFIGSVIALGFIFSLLSFFFVPLFAYISRRNEYQADDFAKKLIGNGNGLANALLELSHDNLSNLHPHPFYWKWYYSHPPTIIRIKRLTGDS